MNVVSFGGCWEDNDLSEVQSFNLPDPLIVTIPVFVLAIALELNFNRKNHRHRYDPSDTTVSIILGLGYAIAGGVVAQFYYSFFAKLYQIRLLTIPFEWWAWPIAIIADDLVYYVYHRAAHRVRWLWAAHVNHHSSPHYNLATAVRNTWTGAIANDVFCRFPLFLLGFHPGMIALCTSINLVYQFWIHTECIDRMPNWFEKIFNTPAHHRIHHASNPPYLDRNYGGTLIIWDRLFGTFASEVKDEPCRFGLVKNLTNKHFIHIVFHEWKDLLSDLWSMPWRFKFAYAFGRPGWSHDGSRQTSDEQLASWRRNKGATQSAIGRERSGDERLGEDPPS